MVAGIGLAGGFGLEGAGDFGLLVGGQTARDLEPLRLRRLVELLPDRQRFVANGTSGREDEEKHRTGVTRGTQLQALAGERHKGDYRERVPSRERPNGWGGRGGGGGGGGRGPAGSPGETTRE